MKGALKNGDWLRGPKLDQRVDSVACHRFSSLSDRSRERRKRVAVDRDWLRCPKPQPMRILLYVTWRVDSGACPHSHG